MEILQRGSILTEQRGVVCAGYSSLHCLFAENSESVDMTCSV